MQEETNQQAIDQAVALEQQETKKRIADITAAFKDDSAFAMEQIQMGSSLTEAKANYADVLKTKNAELKTKNAELKKQKETKVEGAEPVAASDNETSGQTNAVDFMAEAKKVAKEQKIGMTEAMRKVQSENPDSYHAFIEKSGQKKVLLQDGKKKRISKE